MGLFASVRVRLFTCLHVCELICHSLCPFFSCVPFSAEASAERPFLVTSVMSEDRRVQFCKALFQLVILVLSNLTCLWVSVWSEGRTLVQSAVMLFLWFPPPSPPPLPLNANMKQTRTFKLTKKYHGKDLLVTYPLFLLSVNFMFVRAVAGREGRGYFKLLFQDFKGLATVEE